MMMRRIVMSLVWFMPIVALAASVHFKHDPVFTDTGVTLLAEGSLAGLANADVLIVVDAIGDPTVLCTNKGGHKAPGQNPGELTTTGALTVDADKLENGQLFYTLSTAAPVAPEAKAAGCPNNAWHVSITDVAFTAATVTVYQQGVIVLQETFAL